jgi:hypothetical protein
MTNLDPTQEFEKQVIQKTEEIPQDQEAEASREFRRWFQAFRRHNMIMDILSLILFVFVFTICIAIIVRLDQSPDMIQKAIVKRCAEACWGDVSWDDVGKAGTVF